MVSRLKDLVFAVGEGFSICWRWRLITFCQVRGWFYILDCEVLSLSSVTVKTTPNESLVWDIRYLDSTTAKCRDPNSLRKSTFTKVSAFATVKSRFIKKTIPAHSAVDIYQQLNVLECTYNKFGHILMTKTSLIYFLKHSLWLQQLYTHQVNIFKR